MEIPVPTKREVIEEIKRDPDFYRYLKDDAQRNDPDILDALLEGIKTMSGDVEIHGDVNGDVKTMSGDVDCGNVAGDVSSMSGDIKRR